jgi:hypothetical protein
MTREEATRRLESVLSVLAAPPDEAVLMPVSALYVFGSYAHGASTVSDIDVDVEYDVDDKRALVEMQRSMYGRSAAGDLRAALFGQQRIFHVHFQQRTRLSDQLGGLVLLWRRGDSYEQARERLLALRPVPRARRAPRDPVAPALEGLAELLGRGISLHLSDEIKAGSLAVKQIELPEAVPEDPEALESIEDRWGPRNPLRRAALAAAAYLEGTGFAPVQAYGGPAALSADGGRALVDFGTRQLLDVDLYLDPPHRELWLQVVSATRRGPLRALLITAPASTDSRP